MVWLCVRFCQKAPSFLRTVLLSQKQTLNGWSSRSPGFHSSALRATAAFSSSRSSICNKTILPGLYTSSPACSRQLPVHFQAISGAVKKFHTSPGLRAAPALVLWLLVKPLQKITAIILGRWGTSHTPQLWEMSIKLEHHHHQGWMDPNPCHSFIIHLSIHPLSIPLAGKLT